VPRTIPALRSSVKNAAARPGNEPLDFGNTYVTVQCTARRRKDGKTGSFSDLVQQNVRRNRKFAEALLREGVDALLSGDVESGKSILRDYIKATVGFEKLGAATGAPPKSLIRMFGPRGNPQAKNLFSVLGYLQKRAGVRLHVAR
jgi:hypothetical protein